MNDMNEWKPRRLSADEMGKQTEALALAEWIMSGTWDGMSDYGRDQLRKAASELRRFDAELSMATILHGRLTHEAIKAQARCIELEAEIGALRGAVPVGWRLAPIEPTEEMLAAAEEGDREYTRRNFGDVMTVMQGPYDHWCAMLAAAPQPEQGESNEDHD